MLSADLNLIILPTEKCNFRCTYCYEDFKIGRMKPWLVSGIKKLISRRSSTLNNLDISWFGGEPLLAKDIVLDISSFAKKSSETYGFNFYSGATTNGSLLDSRLSKNLLDAGVNHFQISLDGPASVHDKSRVAANGSNTYEKIIKNLLTLKNSSQDFTVVLRIHYTPDTYLAVSEWLPSFSELFADDGRFEFFLKDVGKYGGPNDDLIQTVSSSEQVRIENLLNRGISRPSPTSPKSDACYTCYAAKLNSFVIRADGRLSKCTVAFSSEYNTVGNIDEQGNLNVDMEKLFPWVRGQFTGEKNELACPNGSFHQ